MYEENVHSVLRCGRCNKPFDEQSTLKRHGYYCRSRKTGSTTRSRSCISCAKGKARCDNKRPECSRCKTKAVECHYPASTSIGTRPKTPQSDDAPTERRKNAPSLVADFSNVENRQEESSDGDMILDSTVAISDPEFANIGGEYLDWNDQDFDFADFLNPQRNAETSPFLSSRSPSVALYSTLSTDRIVQVQQAVSAPNVSIPATPTSTLRSFSQRPKLKTGAQRIANLILHTLKSYPLMMLRHGTLPPFIHPHLISFGFENDHMEPLTNCISLVHMISSGVRGNRKLFWKNVRLECERLCDERSEFNKWELLAAMQALFIYILIRLDEGETDHNNFDYLIQATVIVIAQQLALSDIACKTQSALDNHDVDISWKDWIFEESRRRLAVVYRVLNMLVYFEPAAMCDLPPELILAPLPAKKQLWEATDELVWEAESEKKSGAKIAFALAANGELLELGDGPLGCSNALLLYKSSGAWTSPKSTNSWEEWCSGMDGFGGLVMLAASLIG